MNMRRKLMSSESTVSRAEFVHDSLRAEIVGGILKPGTPLRVAVITQKYDVSMSVVREALTRLAEHNLAVLSPNQGFRVVSISKDDLMELTELRTNLECLALSKSIEHGDVQWEAAVVASHHVLERAELSRADGLGSTDVWSEAHANFHDTLVSACQGPRLLELTRTLRNSAEIYRQLSLGVRTGAERDLAHEHRALMELATSRQSAAARAALEAHINLTTELVLASSFPEK
jgi:DNA-binding GntR family transcriptional regulator